MRLGDLGVRERLFIGFGVLIVLLGVEITYTVAWLRHLDDLREALAEDVGPRANAASRLERAVLYRAVSMRDFRRTRDPKYLRAEEEAFRDARAALADLSALARRPEGRAIVNEMKPAAATYAAATGRLLDTVTSGAPIDHSDVEALAARERLLGVARRFSDYQTQKLTGANAGIDAARRALSWGLPCLVLLMLGTILGTGLVVTGAVAGPLRELLAAARSLAKGDYRRALALDPDMDAARPERRRGRRNEFREFAHAFAHAAGRLQQREAALAADVQLSGIFATRLAVNELADNALRAIAMLAHAELGAMYVLEDSTSTLQRAASFPLDVHAPTFAVGDGLPGQAALLKSPVHIRNIPRDTPFRVRLGVDDLPPRAVLAVPILLRNRVHGVVVLASLRDFSEEGIRFVQHAANLLAPSLANALSHREVVRMRSALQEKNEELSAQNAQLQAQREQIQEQNEELQAQREEIQAQNEELRSHGGGRFC